MLTSLMLRAADKSLPPEPKTHIVKSNIRETAIEYLFARNKIDKDHKDAADWFRQRCYEACIDSLPVSDVERVSGTLWAHTAVTGSGCYCEQRG